MTVFLLKSLGMLWLAAGIVVLANALAGRSRQTAQPEQSHTKPRKAYGKRTLTYIRTHKIGFALLGVGVLLGLLEAYPETSPLYPVINWLSGLSAESIGIAITVLVIDF